MSCYYDWEKNRSSDHGFDCRKPVEITCDGVACSDVLRCRTGADGFVEMVGKINGVVVASDDGTSVRTKIVRGKVEVVFHEREASRISGDPAGGAASLEETEVDDRHG
jgi:hypothetical protein